MAKALTEWDKVIDKPYTGDQELIFPPALAMHAKEMIGESLELHGKRVTVHCPSSLKEFVALRSKYGKDAMLCGNAIMAGER